MQHAAMNGDLLTLRNLMKRDPEAYKDEFLQQQRHFLASLQIFKLGKGSFGPDTSASDDTAAVGAGSGHQAHGKKKTEKEFADLVEFLAHAAPKFKTESKELPQQLLDMLDNYSENLEPHLRKTLVKAVAMLSNRDLVPRLKVLPVLFRLFRLQDKPLRALLFSHIVNDVKRVNLTKQNVRLNNSLQNFMFGMLKDANKTAAKKSLDVMVELWRRNVWRDEKTANAISTACFSKHTTQMVTALRFFLGQYEVPEADDEEAKVAEDASEAMRAAKKQAYALKGKIRRTKKREREVERVMKKVKKHSILLNRDDLDDPEVAEERAKLLNLQKNSTKGESQLRLPAISLIFDPQSFAERLFSQLRASSDAFEVRLLMMNVISRFVGTHKLFLFNFYPFLQKYMQPHQRQVTVVLTYLAQASHDLVPPDVLSPCIRTLADQFVTDRSTPEVIAVGLNTVREVCARAPLCMDKDLLADLVQYKKSKNKGIMMAARSLIALFREKNPALLHRRERGKEAAQRVGSHADEAEEEAQLMFGQQEVAVDVPGAELLELAEAEEARKAAQKQERAMKRKRPADHEDARDASSDEDEEDEEDEEDNGDVDFVEELENEEEEEEEEEEEDEEAEEKAGDDAEAANEEMQPAGADQKEMDAEDEEAKMGDAKTSTEKVSIGALRIFSNADFKKIRDMKEKLANQKGGAKRLMREDGSTLLNDSTGVAVEPDELAGFLKRQKKSREERIEALKASKDGRAMFGKGKMKEGKGLTNSEKRRFQPFALAKQKREVREKVKEKDMNKINKRNTHIEFLKKMAKSKRKKQRRL